MDGIGRATLSIMHGEVAWALTHDANYARKLLHAFAVKYVVLDEGYRDTYRAEEILKEIGFTKLFQSGPIVVYSQSNTSILQPLHRGILVISCSPAIVKHLFPEAAEGDSCYLDDYDTQRLSKYIAVILYDYRYKSPRAWSAFLDYVSKGGVLVIDTYRSPDMLRGIPGIGVYSRILKVKGLVELVLWNGTRYSLSLEYRGAVWTATVYSGARIHKLVRLSNYTLSARQATGMEEYTSWD